MGGLVVYMIYAVGAASAILAIEGLWLVGRGLWGAERTVRKRFEIARRAGGDEGRPTGPERPKLAAINQLLAARLPILQRALVASRAPFQPVHVLIAGLALFGGVFLGARAIGVPPAFALVEALAAGLGTPPVVLSVLVSRRRKRFQDQFPQAVDLIARGLQAGYPVASAIAVVAKQMPDPVGGEFATVVDEMTYGLDRNEAFGNLAQRFPLPEVSMFCASLEVTRETGGNIAEVFLKLGEVVRAKAQLNKKVVAISAEGRLSFWVISALPFVVAGALLALRPDYYSDVANDPMFWPAMSFAPLLLGVGSFVTWRMVNIKI